MTPVETHPVHKAIHRPLLWFGVERQLLIVVLLTGAVPWGITGYLLLLPILIGPLYITARFATRRDPQMLKVLAAAWRLQRPARWWKPLRTHFDPLKHTPFTIEVR